MTGSPLNQEPASGPAPGPQGQQGPVLHTFGELTPVRILRRVNRFAVLVEHEGQERLAHLPNSGRLHELLHPQAPALLRWADAPGRRTVGDLVLVQAAGPDGTGWVSVDARLPARLGQAILQHQLLADFAPLEAVRTEVAFGQSRLDLAGTVAGTGQPFWGEAKSVTLVEEGVARFPDAPTARGRRHLEELMEARRQGALALVLFVVLRDDARLFAPHHEADPAFAETLAQAAARGVEVRACACTVSPQGIRWLQELPVQVAEGPSRR